MIHIMDGEWQVFGQDTQINCRPLYAYLKLKKREPETVSLSEIAHKPISGICVNSARYTAANLKQPVLLAESMVNPLGRRYRMLDGRHRVKKMITLKGESILALVVSAEEARKFIEVR